MSQLSFGTTTDSIKGNQYTPYLDRPFLGTTTLHAITKDSYSDGIYEVLKFDFQLGGTNEIGDDIKGKMIGSHTEFGPQPGDELKDPETGKIPFQTTLNRIGFILKQFYSEETAIELTQVDGDTLEEVWDNLRDQILDFAEQNPVDEEVRRIKFLPSKNNGEYRFQPPKYVGGWISGPEDDVQVSVSKREKDDIRQWKMMEQAQPTGGDGAFEEEESDWAWN